MTSRQEAFDEEKLKDTKITIIGAGTIANYLSLYMLGLGIGNIRILSESQNPEENFLIRGESKNLEEKLREINKKPVIDVIKGSHEDYTIGDPDILIDVTNNPNSKKISKEFSKKIKNVKLAISTASSYNNCSLYQQKIQPANTNSKLSDIVFKPNKLNAPLLINDKMSKLYASEDYFLMNSYVNKKQGSFTSGLIAAIALDEIRKAVAPMENESLLKSKLEFSLCKNKRFNKGLDFTNEKGDNLSGLKVLVVGAGGIGTYTCLNLALMGAGQIDIYDGDIVDPHNLNRQVLYYDAVGKKKAEILEERLRKIAQKGTKINAYPIFLESTNKLGKYDLIMSCLDNWKYRFMLSDYAKEKNTYFVNAAVTAFLAKVEYEVCLSCMPNAKSLRESEEKKPSRASCSALASSNVVMPNAIAGALMAAEAKVFAYPSLYKKLDHNVIRYNSKTIKDCERFLISGPYKCKCGGIK
ncbi:MAG: ThiF family adenylyltransferase [Nanoarchaeota archaeon]|nr:ThiF family adenylyltransferase [Nanoarchaeota archaeon]